MKFYSFLFLGVLIVSLALTNNKISNTTPQKENGISSVENEGNLSRIAFHKSESQENNLQEASPKRNWTVLDPQVTAHGMLIESLDDQFPFFRYHADIEWPTASLTKLLTAVVVLEEIGENKKIPINATAIVDKNDRSEIQSGEVYASEDLLKIMLLASSNNAARAFEESLRGRDEAIKLLNKKARSIGMAQSLFYDAAGLADLNVTTAYDMMKLVRYIVHEHPNIFAWTRLPSLIVQPLNDGTSKTIYNINPFVAENDYRGGKTGTSPQAQENLVSIFSLNNMRIGVIVLGSENRKNEIQKIVQWIKTAYTF